MSEALEFVYSILRADGGWFKVGEETAKKVTIAYLAHNPAFLRSILSPKQVEALEWAEMVARERATRKLEEGVVNHAEVLDGRAKAIRSLLGGDEHAE